MYLRGDGCSEDWRARREREDRRASLPSLLRFCCRWAGFGPLFSSLLSSSLSPLLPLHSIPPRSPVPREVRGVDRVEPKVLQPGRPVCQLVHGLRVHHLPRPVGPDGKVGRVGLPGIAEGEKMEAKRGGGREVSAGLCRCRPVGAVDASWRDAGVHPKPLLLYPPPNSHSPELSLPHSPPSRLRVGKRRSLTRLNYASNLTSRSW